MTNEKLSIATAALKAILSIRCQGGGAVYSPERAVEEIRTIANRALNDMVFIRVGTMPEQEGKSK